MTVQLLDSGVLAAYERLLPGQGVPVDEWARPGLSEVEMEEALVPLGLRLPVEARCWWGWHDGAKGLGKESMLGPFRHFLSLADAIDAYEGSRESANFGASQGGPPPWDDPDFLWRPEWFPIGGDGGHEVVVDCSVAEGEATPLRFIDWQDVDGFFEPMTASLGEMVAYRVRALESGGWRWNAGDMEWERNEALLERAFWANPVL